MSQLFIDNGRARPTILAIWSVFHTKMAFDTKLKQLALFMISW